MNRAKTSQPKLFDNTKCKTETKKGVDSLIVLLLNGDSHNPDHRPVFKRKI